MTEVFSSEENRGMMVSTETTAKSEHILATIKSTTSMNNVVAMSRNPSPWFSEPSTNTISKIGSEVDQMNIEKYLERLDQDRRESEARAAERIKDMEQHVRESEERTRREKLEFEARLDARFSQIDQRFERMETEIKKFADDVRKDSKDSRNWLIGLTLTTILAVGGMTLSIYSLISSLISITP